MSSVRKEVSRQNLRWLSIFFMVAIAPRVAIADIYAVKSYEYGFDDDIFILDDDGNEVAFHDLTYNPPILSTDGGQGLALAPNGLLYMLANDLDTQDDSCARGLVTIDPATYEVDFVSCLDGEYYNALTFDTEGRLYVKGGSDDYDGEVFEYNFVEDSLTEVTELGVHEGYDHEPFNLGFAAGSLYYALVDHRSDPDVDEVYYERYNLSTGVNTRIDWSDMDVETTYSIGDPVLEHIYGMVYQPSRDAFLLLGDAEKGWRVTLSGEASPSCDACGTEEFRGLASVEVAQYTFGSLISWQGAPALFYVPTVPVPSLPPIIMLLATLSTALIGLTRIRSAG